MPQNLDDWPSLVHPRNERPPDGDPGDPQVQLAFRAFVMRLGPLDLPDLRRVSQAVQDAHFENENSPAGPQCCVVVDGGPVAGKTFAALTAAFRETRSIWEALDPDATPGHRSIPWAYVEAPSGAGSYSIMSSLCRFLGIPKGARTNTSAAAAKVRAVAPLVGLRGVIIDDSHGLAGAGRARAESAALANTLKTAVTGLPATVVIVGAGLRQSKVFDNVFGDQIEQRARWVMSATGRYLRVTLLLAHGRNW